MGKFVKKGKIKGDLGVMEAPQSLVGVRTRARTLALQQSPDYCYLQLRNRRLVKARFPPLSPARKQERNRQGSRQRSRSGKKRVQRRRKAGSKLRVESVSPVATVPDSVNCSNMGGEVEVELKIEEIPAMVVETVENNMELDGTGRTTRESTPSSFMRDLRPIAIPVRSTHPRVPNQIRVPVQPSIPSIREIDEFFDDLGKQQQKQFMEKYNFDVTNDSPLQGRYEWVRVDP